MALGFVRERERSGRKDNDCGEACIYRDGDDTVLLHRCPWRFTSEGHVAIMQHIGGCSTFPRTPGLSGGRSYFSGFHVKELALKTGLMFVSVSSADKDAEKTFDGFNRMHMIWIDRV